MSGTTVAGRSTEGRRASLVDGLRAASFGTAVALLIQYGLGMWVNLYATVPARDHGGGVGAAIGRALANGPAGLAVHAGLGLLLVLGSISILVRAIMARSWVVIVTSSIALIALAGAAMSGASFVNASSNGASLSMALLTAVALLCLLVNLFVLKPRPTT
jgi:hypothetical protein